jgi:hypothetical protein
VQASLFGLSACTMVPYENKPGGMDGRFGAMLIVSAATAIVLLGVCYLGRA